MSENSLWATSRSWMTWSTWRRACTSPRLALLMSRSASGRTALARASVVWMRSDTNSEAARFDSMCFWCCGLPPKRGPLRGAGTALLLPGDGGRGRAGQREAAVVEALEHLLQRLLAEVGDAEEVLLGAGDRLAEAVDLGPLQAVAGTLGQVEGLDGEVEVGAGRALFGAGAHGQALGLAQVGEGLDEADEGLGRRRQRVAG